MSTDSRSHITAAVQKLGAASVARTLGVSREALLSYCAGASRAATVVVIEQRADRLERCPVRP